VVDSELLPTKDLIAWARDNCPVPVASLPRTFAEAKAAYDDVDGRLGDDAEGDAFLSKALWMETTIRLAQLGWTVEHFEDVRWPIKGRGNLNALLSGI